MEAESPNQTVKKSKLNLLDSASNFFIGNLEKGFYKWGGFVARRPLIVIVVCALLVGSSLIGFLKFHTEGRAEKLWLPQDSPYIKHKEWLDINFPRNTRQQYALFVSEDENILNPKAFMQMLKLHQRVQNLRVKNATFSKLCFKLPIANIFLSKKKRKRRQVSPFGEQTIGTTIRITEQTTEQNQEEANTVKDDGFLIPVVFNERARTTTGRTTSNGRQIQEPTTKQDLKIEPETTTIKTQDILSEYDPFGDYDLDDYYDYDEDDLTAHTDSFFTKDSNSGQGGSSSSTSQNDIVDDLPRNIYCDLVNTLNEKCWENSILEMWRFDEERISKLTQQDIIDAVNSFDESPVYGYGFDYSSILGSVERNATNHVVSAKAIATVWHTKIDETMDLSDDGGAGIELDLADGATLEWEKALIEEMVKVKEEAKAEDGIDLYMNAARSFNDISSNAIYFDAFKMAAGYLLMFVYTQVMMGKFNLVEHRFYLVGFGLAGVAMGLGVAYGMSSAIGLAYTPIHLLLPFLCLGIGIDDMFVIVQCWNNLSPIERTKPLEERLALTMQHAGVAITVTSLTDVFAFGMGAVTILPGLESFCVTCAIGIGSVYLLQASWFVAWFSIDQRRIEQKRDGLFPWIKRDQGWTPNAFSQRQIGKELFTKFASCLKKKWMQGLVLISTLTFLGFGTWGSLLIRQEFDPIQFLPLKSYLKLFIDAQRTHYPNGGWKAEVYTGPLHDPLNDFMQLDDLVDRLQGVVAKGNILRYHDSWWPKFKTYIKRKNNVTDWTETFHIPISERSDLNAALSNSSLPLFNLYLSDFLFSKAGSKYKKNINFDKEIACNLPVSNITATQFTIGYAAFSGPEEHIPARALVEATVKESNFSSQAFSFSKVYAAWETDEVIGFELWRNLGLATICVFVITLIMLANLKICLMVLACVVLTLVDIVGFIHFWGLTIDTLSCINIVLAIGLCVDYSAHIAHAFLVAEGSRMDRAVDSISSMGPAIMNGGITTFLAIALLVFSQSYAFIVFFKVFLLTVSFGLFHGLVFLPVILGLVGPNNNTESSDRHISSPTSDANTSEVTESTSGVSSGSDGNGNKLEGFVLQGVSNDGYVHDELPGKGWGMKRLAKRLLSTIQEEPEQQREGTNRKYSKKGSWSPHTDNGKKTNSPATNPLPQED